MGTLLRLAAGGALVLLAMTACEDSAGESASSPTPAPGLLSSLPTDEPPIAGGRPPTIELNTPEPTFTLQPTPTPNPTYTPVPTPTPLPTNTPTPAPPLNVYESGQTIPDFSSGFPNVVRGGASLQMVGGNVVITMGNGGTVEYSHATYTCVSGEGCGIENGLVTTGTIRVVDPSDVESPTLIPTATPQPTATPRPTPRPTASERAVLVALYHSTGGASWDANANWLSDRPIGQWHGVTTDSNGRVIRLVLQDNRLTGEIPPELGGLSNLTWLGLVGNRLTGEIPPELGGLSNLEVLYLYFNRLTGEIPPELGGLSNLTRLHLLDNRLTGEIPPELGGLSNLTELSLEGNRLTGEIPPELGGLSNLKYLALAVNRLRGEIPPELGRLSNLTRLRLYSNQLTGCIPEGLRDIADNDLALLNLPDCGAATPGATPTPTPTHTPTPASERADGVCHVGLIVRPGESCTYPGTSEGFSVDSSGRGQFLFFTAGTGIDARNTTINGVTYNFKASKQGDGNWIIEAAGDS